MAIKIDKPTIVAALGNKPKLIEEFIGRVNSQTDEVSIARMKSPSGWVEPGQAPEFTEYTVVLQGMLQVRTEQEVFEVGAGQAIIVSPGSGFNTARPAPRGPSISRCVSLRLGRRRPIVTRWPNDRERGFVTGRRGGRVRERLSARLRL